MSLKRIIAEYVGAIQGAKTEEEANLLRSQAHADMISLARDQANANKPEIVARLENLAAQFAHRPEQAPPPVTQSDFSQLLTEAVEASEVGGGSDIEEEAAERILHKQSEEHDRISIAPASLHSGTRIGDQTTVKFAPEPEDVALNVLQEQTVVFWQGRKHESQTFTVDCHLLSEVPLPDPSSVMPFNSGTYPYARVRYGADGVQHEVLMDVGSGVRFTAAGNYLSVVVGQEAPFEGDVPYPLKVGASMGFFAATSVAPLFRTMRIDKLNPGDALEPKALIRRPTRAVQLCAPQNSELGSYGLYQFLDSALVLLYEVKIFNSALGNPIPLSNDTAFVRVIHGGSNVANYRLPFQLAL